MLDLISMWKSPKMIAYVLLTAVLYFALIFPFKQFAFFGQADFFRLGIGIPVAFSFLFGPAAAWGAAFGNIIYDAATTGLSAASIFGFIGNFLIGYIPYKLWTALTAEKPDLRSFKKVSLFVGISFLASTVCGLLVGWALLWLYSLPFVMMAFTVASTDALWAIIVGSIVLALSYDFVSKRRLLYTDILGIEEKPSWSKPRNLALLAFVISASICFVLPTVFTVDVIALLPLVAVSVVAAIATCK